MLQQRGCYKNIKNNPPPASRELPLHKGDFASIIVQVLPGDTCKGLFHISK